MSRASGKRGITRSSLAAVRQFPEQNLIKLLSMIEPVASERASGRAGRELAVVVSLVEIEAMTSMIDQNLHELKVCRRGQIPGADVLVELPGIAEHKPASVIA